MKNTIQLLLTVATVTFILIVVLVLPHVMDDYDPTSWYTMIVGAVFGLIIAIIISHDSNKTLTFLKNSETKRRQIGLTIIKYAIQDLTESRELYFKILNRNNELETSKKRDMLQMLLPTFRSVLARVHNSIPLLSESIDGKLHELVEMDLRQLSILFIILESGNNVHFEKHIEELVKHSEDLRTKLSKIS